MKSNISVCLIFVCIIFFNLSCSMGSSEEPISSDRITTKQPEKLPITETSQSLNLKYGDLFNLIVSVLKNRNIQIEQMDSSGGRIVTSAFDLKESLCGSVGSDRIPLVCNLVYTIKVTSINRVASKFKINYLENCANYEFSSLQCPGSRAERLMLDIVDDIKISAGVLDEY